MSFAVGAAAYSAFMGRFSEPLADAFLDLLAPAPGSTALDVGCGPGAFTARLVERLGSDAVAACDPQPGFVEAARERLPGVRVEQSTAEHLPFDDDVFDVAAAQLVVHFMSDPVAGIREMARVTRPGGAVAASVWDHAGHRGPLAAFWNSARDLDADVVDEGLLAGAREGHLGELFESAGLSEIQATTLEAPLRFESFEEWWSPFELGVGPAGDHVSSLEPEGVAALRQACQARLGSGPFVVDAAAWTVVGRV